MKYRITDNSFPPLPHQRGVGDFWNEHLSTGEKVRWEWDGKVWVYHSDTVQTHERREEG